jgi:hypothetical protein
MSAVLGCAGGGGFAEACVAWIVYVLIAGSIRDLACDGAALLQAGAATGKARAMLHESTGRIAYRVSGGTWASRILLPQLSLSLCRI